MKTLREVLEQFTEDHSPDKFKRMKVAVEDWAEETGHIVYPIGVNPLAATGENEGPITFEVTFKCVPKV